MIGVMSGLQDEIRILVDTMTGAEVVPTLDRSAYIGELEGHKTVVVGSGVGKVRAAAFAQHLIDGFHIDRMIVFGLAGALDGRLGIGDVVISRSAVMYDYVVAGEGVNEDITIGAIPADPDLIRLARTAGVRVAGGGLVREGIILTGDTAIASSRQRARLRREFNGDCVEMEGAAVALVCSLNRVPFVIVRAISDRADEDAHNQFARTFADASRASARVVLEMLRLMHGGPPPSSAPDPVGSVRPPLRPEAIQT